MRAVNRRPLSCPSQNSIYSVTKIDKGVLNGPSKRKKLKTNKKKKSGEITTTRQYSPADCDTQYKIV